MGWLFSFNGRIGRLHYALAMTAVFFIPHLLALGLWVARGLPPELTVWFLINPLRLGLINTGAEAPAAAALAVAGLGVAVIAAWISAALAVRRANDAQVSGWFAALAIAPVLQIPAMLYLAYLPSREGADDTDHELTASAPSTTLTEWKAALRGLIAGAGFALFAVAIGGLLFGAYGYAMFVLTPVMIGMTTAYLANRRSDIGLARTLRIMTVALLAGGLALVAVALEGVICIVMAAPLAWVMALVGVLIGRTIVRTRHSRASPTLRSFVVLPFLFAVELVVPQTTAFTDVRSIDVAASPAQTWEAVLHMQTIADPPSAPFRLGVAYPVRGEVMGEGIGAIRRGYFSTGVAVERVTEWAPDRVLGFTILSEPPVLRELSPYGHIDTPHLRGYFRSVDARITLEPLPSGSTRVTLVTTHELELQPAVYWLPMTRWVVQRNKARVLEQIQRQAQAAEDKGKSGLDS